MVSNELASVIFPVFSGRIHSAPTFNYVLNLCASILEFSHDGSLYIIGKKAFPVKFPE